MGIEKGKKEKSGVPQRKDNIKNNYFNLHFIFKKGAVRFVIPSTKNTKFAAKTIAEFIKKKSLEKYGRVEVEENDIVHSDIKPEELDSIDNSIVHHVFIGDHDSIKDFDGKNKINEFEEKINNENVASEVKLLEDKYCKYILGDNFMKNHEYWKRDRNCNNEEIMKKIK